MGKEKTQTVPGSLNDINFTDIEEGLGLVLPESGDKGKGEETKTEPVNLPGGVIDFTQMIEVPETEEDFLLLEKKDTKVTGGDDDVEEKVESKEEVKTTKEDDGEDEDAIITEDSPLYLHAATLHEEGILPTLDLESLKGKKFSEAFQLYLDSQKSYIEQGRDEFKNSLSERQKQYLELIEKGIPDQIAEHQSNIEDAYGKITDEMLSDDEELQEQLIVQNLKLKGLSDKKVQVFVKVAKDDERLFEESKEARDEINAYIDNQRKEILRKAEEEERAADQREAELKKTIESTIKSVEEILPGIKVSASEKTRLFELMTKPVEIRTINGQKIPVNLINKVRSEDAISFDLRLNYFIEQGMFKKDFDLSKLNKKLTSSAASKLASKLKEEVGGPGGKGLKIERKKEERKVPPIVFPNIKL